MGRIEIVSADITTLAVDGAIHRAAGPELLAECRMLQGCRTGSAKITKGYRLPAAYVIHAVGPIWRGGAHGEPEALASCHHVAMELAESHGLRSVAFPAISCGVYAFPVDQAAEIAIPTVLEELCRRATIERVVFTVREAAVEKAFRASVERHCAPSP